MATVETGTCEICGKENVPILRKYFLYPDIKCECHSPHHFDLVFHCKDCIPKQPDYTKVELRTANLRMKEE